MNTLLEAIPYIIVVCSLLMLRPACYSFLPTWARMLLVLSAVCGVASGVLGVFVHKVRIRSDMGRYLDHYQTFFGGITVGLALGLLISGQFTQIWRINRWKW